MSNRRPRGAQPFRLGALLTLIGCFALGTPAVAQASAFASSTISVPTSGTVLFYEGDQGAGSVTVSGSISPAGAGSGDLLCYTSAGALPHFAIRIPISASGAFGATVSLSAIHAQSCRLRFVPAGAMPSTTAATPFAGPIVTVSDQYSYSSGGVLYGYDMLGGVASFAYELGSLGECAIRASFATDLNALSSYYLFDGNLCLPESSGIAPNPGTRSGVQVDGLDAYPPGSVVALTSLPGFLPLTYNATWTGDHSGVTVTETNSLMYCAPPGGYPPTSADCPSMMASGIVVHQTTTLLGGGQIARVTEQFVDTDGKPHTLDVLFTQAVRSPVASEPPGFEFPGQLVFASHRSPESFSLFPPGPGTMYVLADAAAAPAVSNPIGAITYQRPPVSADFITGGGAQIAKFLMHYVARVPARGAVTYRWSFAQAAGLQPLASLVASERDRFFRPTLKVTRPRSGRVVHFSPVRVIGVATDPVGVSLVSVNGQVAVVGAHGRFSAMERLRRGVNRIVVVASNLGGVTRSRRVTVRYVPGPCLVPTLRGRTLSAARTTLLERGCAVGAIHLQHSRSVPRGRVIGTLPAGGRQRRHGSRVALFLSSGPR
jgi:hypothetical protein